MSCRTIERLSPPPDRNSRRRNPFSGGKTALRPRSQRFLYTEAGKAAVEAGHVLVEHFFCRENWVFRGKLEKPSNKRDSCTNKAEK